MRPPRARASTFRNLINLQPDETVKAFLPVKEFVPDQFIVMVTKFGVIKKCELTEFDNPMSRGIIALGVDDGDELIAARLTSGNEYIFLGSHEGQAIRFKEDQVRAMGRPARGVRGMDLAEGDFIVGAEVVARGGADSFDLRTRLRQAHERDRLPADQPRRQGRHQHEDHATRPARWSAILSVKEDSELMIVTRDGKMIRIDSGEIRQAGRSTQGVRLVGWRRTIRWRRLA